MNPEEPKQLTLDTKEVPAPFVDANSNTSPTPEPQSAVSGEGVKNLDREAMIKDMIMTMFRRKKAEKQMRRDKYYKEKKKLRLISNKSQNATMRNSKNFKKRALKRLKKQQANAKTTQSLGDSSSKV